MDIIPEYTNNLRRSLRKISMSIRLPVFPVVLAHAQAVDTRPSSRRGGLGSRLLSNAH